MENIINIITCIIIFILLYLLYNTIFNKPHNSTENIINNVTDNSLINNKKKYHKRIHNKKIINKKKNIEKNIKKEKNNLVYLDVSESIDGNESPIGRITIKLYDEIVPYTCKNFKKLCRNKKYLNSPFHRIIKDFMIQGGDYTNGDGTGGKSIYGSKFNDENFKILHDRPYLVSMANSGPNTNGSQFFITTDKTSHLDGKHVIFGTVLDGFEVVDYLNTVNTDNSDRPINNVYISNCGCI